MEGCHLDDAALIKLCDTSLRAQMGIRQAVGAVGSTDIMQLQAQARRNRV